MARNIMNDFEDTITQRLDAIEAGSYGTLAADVTRVSKALLSARRLVIKGLDRSFTLTGQMLARSLGRPNPMTIKKSVAEEIKPRAEPIATEVIEAFANLERGIEAVRVSHFGPSALRDTRALEELLKEQRLVQQLRDLGPKGIAKLYEDLTKLGDDEGRRAIEEASAAYPGAKLTAARTSTRFDSSEEEKTVAIRHRRSTGPAAD